MNKVVPSNAHLVPDGAERKFEGEIFSVYQWPQEMFDGSYETFEMLKRCDTVSAVCITEKGIIVLDEEQPSTGPRRNFPGGRVDATDESIVAAAQREVLEETGYSFANWRLVQVLQPQKKIEWFVYRLIAWGETAHVEPKLEPGERITPQFLSFDDLKERVLAHDGHLGEFEAVIKSLSSTEDLLATPEFQGKIVDR